MIITNLSKNAALAAAASVFIVAATSAFAASPQTGRPPTTVSDAKPVQAASVEVDEEETVNCAKSRKRLWVEGEGWLVRKVTTCH